MSYTPPAGNAADLRFPAGTYTPPAGNAADFIYPLEYRIAGLGKVEFLRGATSIVAASVISADGVVGALSGSALMLGKVYLTATGTYALGITGGASIFIPCDITGFGVLSYGGSAFSGQCALVQITPMRGAGKVELLSGGATLFAPPAVVAKGTLDRLYGLTSIAHGVRATSNGKIDPLKGSASMMRVGTLTAFGRLRGGIGTGQIQHGCWVSGDGWLPPLRGNADIVYHQAPVLWGLGAYRLSGYGELTSNAPATPASPNIPEFINSLTVITSQNEFWVITL